jgi:hypothetical protein
MEVLLEMLSFSHKNQLGDVLKFLSGAFLLQPGQAGIFLGLT